MITLRFSNTKYAKKLSGGFLCRWPFIGEKKNNDNYVIQGKITGFRDEQIIPLRDNEDHTIAFVLDRDVNPALPGSTSGQWPVYYRGQKIITSSGPFPSLFWEMRGRTGGEYIK